MHTRFLFRLWLDKLLGLLLSIHLLACQSSSSTQTKLEENHLQDSDTLSISEKKDSILVAVSDNFETEEQILSSSINQNMLSHLESIIKAMQSGDSVRWLCYGNSITHGYRVGSFGQVKYPYPEVLETMLQEKYANPNIFVINEGHNGWRSDQALHNLESMVLSQTPDIVSIMFGINDAYSNFSLEFYKMNMQGMIDRLLKANISVLLLSPTPIHTPFDSMVSDYGEVLSQIAQEEQIAWINVNQALRRRLEYEEMTLASILPDDIHLADERYRWIAECIFHEIIKPFKNRN